MEKSAPLLGPHRPKQEVQKTTRSKSIELGHAVEIWKSPIPAHILFSSKPKNDGHPWKYKPIGPDYLRIRKRSVVSYKTRPPSRFSSELSIFQMAVAVGNCYFSVVTSAVKLRSSVSAAQPCFAASLWSTSCCHTFKPVCQSKRAPNSRKGSSSFDQSRSEVKP